MDTIFVLCLLMAIPIGLFIFAHTSKGKKFLDM